MLTNGKLLVAVIGIIFKPNVSILLVLHIDQYWSPPPAPLTQTQLISHWASRWRLSAMHIFRSLLLKVRWVDKMKLGQWASANTAVHDRLWIMWTLIRRRNLSLPTLDLDQWQPINIFSPAVFQSRPAAINDHCCYHTSVGPDWAPFQLLQLATFFFFFISIAIFDTERPLRRRRRVFGLCNPTTSTFMHPSHSSTTSFLPHSKCSDEVSCLLIYSV